MSLWNLKNPVPENFDDDDRLKTFIDKTGIIPYYGQVGNSSHGFLRLLDNLTSLSPSFGAVMNDLKGYAYGGGVHVTNREEYGLESEEEEDELSREERREFLVALRELGVSASNWKKTSEIMLQNRLESGNVWLRVTVAIIGNQARAWVKVEHYRHVAYLKPEKGEENIRIAIVSKKFDIDYWKKNPPEIFDVTLADTDNEVTWRDRGDGVYEAMLHWADIKDGNGFYGRPDILQVLQWLFVENALGDAACKTTANLLLTKMIAMFERNPYRKKAGKDDGGGSQKDSFQSNMIELKTLTTNQGQNVSEILGIEYAKGSTAPTFEKISITRDHQYNTATADQAGAFIYSNMGWARELTNVKQTRSNLGGNNLRDLFTISDVRTIQPIQLWTEDIIDIVNGAIWNFLEGTVALPELRKLKFNNLISDLVETFVDQPPEEEEEVIELGEGNNE